MDEQEAVGGEGSLLTPEPTTTSEDWYGEYKGVVEQKGWKSPADAIKSYTELEKTMGGRLKMPTPESSAEEIRAFYQKTGCPENPDGYEIQVGEEAARFRDEATENELKGVAHQMGVSKQAFEAIVGKYYEHMATQVAAGAAAGEKTLREELGAGYDEGLAVAQRFAGSCSDEFMQLMDSTGLGNNPIIIKQFIDLGKKTMNDSLIKGQAGDGEPGYKPQYSTSPEMYATGEDEESTKARAYFTAKGHKY